MVFVVNLENIVMIGHSSFFVCGKLFLNEDKTTLFHDYHFQWKKNDQLSKTLQVFSTVKTTLYKRNQQTVSFLVVLFVSKTP